MSSASKVLLPDTSSATKRSEPLTRLSEDTAFGTQKHLKIHKRGLSPSSLVSYAEVLSAAFAMLRVALITSTTYKTYVSADLHAQSMNNVKCFVESDSSPTLINKIFLHLALELCIKR